MAAQKEPTHRHIMMRMTFADVGSSITSVSPSSSSPSMRGSMVPWSGCAASSRGRCSSSSSGDGGSTVMLPRPVAIFLRKTAIESVLDRKQDGQETLNPHTWAYDTHATFESLPAIPIVYHRVVIVTDTKHAYDQFEEP
jgi:hypothetical protein